MKNAKAKIRAWNRARLAKRNNGKIRPTRDDRPRNGLLNFIKRLKMSSTHIEQHKSQEIILQAHRPGPHFEPTLVGDEVLAKQAAARLFAFYLPQFYPFKENNEWWGAGFTEWRNVTRAMPRFEGHLQPRLPRDLGFYDLRNLETIREQVQMARRSGVSGFCFYYYWFDTHRLLDRPLDLFIEDQENNFPFCLMWANENWTRRWDGREQNVLMAQNYQDEHDELLVDDLARYFKDSRYECIDGRPLFIIYRPGIIPKFEERLARWRELFRTKHGLNPIILMAQAFGDIDPNTYKLDGAIEFPPHKLSQGMPHIHNKLKIFDPHFSGRYMSYDNLVDASLKENSFPYELIRTLVPSWDNEARKPSKGMGFVGATPQKYESWLRALSQRALDKPFLDKKPYVFVNAWNEWAEGAILEPDLHHGSAYLNATFRALTGISQASTSCQKIILVGHDAHRHGAQLLLLNILKTLSRQFGLEPIVLLLEGGPLLPEYQSYGEVIVLPQQSCSEKEVVRKIVAANPGITAITNTVICGRLAKTLALEGVSTISLIHELSSLIKERNLEKEAKAIARHSKKIIFPSKVVQSSFESFVSPLGEKAIIRPQGIYQPIERRPELHSELRKRLRISANSQVVTNIGFADLRKGFDLFVRLANHVITSNPDCHFLWLGEIDKKLKHWLQVEIEQAPLAGRLHILPFDNDISCYLNGTDVFALTSREDPFPSVALEAMACGVPVVSFQGGGGIGDAIEMVHQGGNLVPMGDTLAMSETVQKLLKNPSNDAAKLRAKTAHERFNWKDYVFSLLETSMPEIKRISVVVPNYNYAQHLPERLRSIFDQSYPVYEVLVLDDHSTDNSVEIATATARTMKRDITLVCNEKNSGSVFKQWKKGAEMATGNYIWIAEADDSAKPDFLSNLAKKLKSETRLAFCDSAQIDAQGKNIGESYAFYYKDLPWNPLENDYSGSGLEFVRKALSIKNIIMNVSGVLMERAALCSAFSRLDKDILSYRLAGDWLLYCSILMENGAQVAYSSKPNNIHRRHGGGVTSSLKADLHLEEIERVHKYIHLRSHLPAAALHAQQKHLDTVAHTLKANLN